MQSQDGGWSGEGRVGGVGILAAVASSDIGLISSFEKSLHVVLRIGLGKFQ